MEMFFWVALVVIVVALAVVVADYIYTQHGQTTPSRVATANGYIQRYSWVVAIVVGVLLSIHLLIGAVGKREVPWMFLFVLHSFIWSVVGTFITARMSQAFSQWLGKKLGFWGKRALKFGSEDNASGNIKLAFAAILWVLVFLQGWPTWGPDFTEVSYRVTQAGERAWQSNPAGETRSFLSYVVSGGKVPFIERALGRTVVDPTATTPWSTTAPAPLYRKSWWWFVLAIIVTVISQIDWVLTRRDDFGEAVTHAAQRAFGHRLKPVEATSDGGTPATAPAQAPVTASAPVAPMHGISDMVRMFGQFLSDLSAAFVVNRVSSRK